MESKCWIQLSLVGGHMIRNILGLAFVSCFGLMTAGCGGGFQAMGVSNRTQAATPIDPVVATNKQITALNTNIGDLNTTVTGVTGQLNLITLLNLQTQAGSGSSTPGSNKLSLAMGQLLDNLVTGVTNVYNNIKKISLDIQTRIAQLNPADATQAKVIAQLQSLSSQLTNFKTQIDSAVNNLAAKMLALDSKVDSDIANMNSSNPLTWIVEAYWVPVKTQIQQHHDALVALTM